jgi:ABC-2 type transport system ATP-binding protein
VSTPRCVVACQGVSKHYGKLIALDRFDLAVPEGEIFGLLGPNGAGKTTLIKILVGLAAPTAGSIALFGHDVLSHRRRAVQQLGAVVEAPLFYEYMSGWENLYHLCALSGGASRRTIQRALEIVGLTDAAQRHVKTYSYGMKQRLGIAQALLPDSRFLLLDEPTNGLDPHGIAGVRDLIRRLAREHGMTIFLSSHLLVEVEQICDRVAIVHRGRKVLEGDVKMLQTHRRQTIVRLRTSDAARALLTSLAPETVEEAEGTLIARLNCAPEDAPDLVRRLAAAPVDVLEVRPHVRTLEDIFIEHTLTDGDHVRTDAIRAAQTVG